MSIADKLNYLITTKGLLKDNINKINNVLTDQSTFRSYPQELFNGYLDILNNGTDTLWNNLEKVSASGETPVLENVETAPIKMVLNGNTSQDTTSGKNLIKIVGLSSEEEKTKTVNGVTFTVNDDGTIKVEGTNSGSSRILQPVTYESAVTGEAGTYYYFANSPSQSKRLEMACFVDDKYEYPNSYGTTPWSKTATTNFTIRNIYFVINAGETVNNVYYVILTRNVDPQPYEPYTGGQPSPSPDYPQQVKVVKGENVVSVSGKNLFDSANVEQGKISSAGVISGDTTRIRTNEILYLNAGTYTISFDTPTNVNYHIYSTGGVWEKLGNTSWQTSPYTFTLTERKGIKFVFRNIGDSAITPSDLTNCQLEEGSTATDYVPYSKTDYPINLNANMFDSTQIPENNFEKRLSTTGALYGDVDYFVSDWIPIQPNTEYEVNWTPEAKKRICFYSSFLTSSFISYNDTENIFKTPNNATYMRFSNLTSEISNLSVKLKNSLELCKINTYKDYFHKDSGKWYVHKEINKIVLNGSENWSERTNANNVKQFFVGNTIPAVKNITQYCNYFAKYNQNLYNYGSIGEFAILTNSRQFFGCVNSDLTLENFKTLLASNNLIVYYVLATPTEEEITNTTLIEQLEEIANAKSVKDKTYITQTNDDLPFILDVEAIKEYEVN